MDPSYELRPYAFDPNLNGGLATITSSGFDIGTVFMQAVNIDADFVTRIAGVSQGLAIHRTPPSGMVAIEPGTFEMGSNAASDAPYFNGSAQQPVHTVTISSPFWMGEHEVTQAEYEALMGSNPSYFVGPDIPVESVSWYAALDFSHSLRRARAVARSSSESAVRSCTPRSTAHSCDVDARSAQRSRA